MSRVAKSMIFPYLRTTSKGTSPVNMAAKSEVTQYRPALAEEGSGLLTCCLSSLQLHSSLGLQTEQIHSTENNHSPWEIIHI